MPRHLVLFLLTAVLAFSCFRIFGLEREKAQLKRDRIEVAHIKYGLFNVDEWKQLLAGILTKKINALAVTKQNRPEMKRKVEELLYKVVDEVEQVMKEQNRGSVSGLFQQFLMDLFGSMDKVRKGVPRYADRVIDYLNDPKNRAELRNYLVKQLNDAVDHTIGRMDYTAYNAVLARYGATDKAGCKAAIDGRMAEVRAMELTWFTAVGLCAVLLAALALGSRISGTIELGVLVAGAAILLITGLALPMIDIEATISTFSFTLMGEPVTFTDQVLFFQSKSILQVVTLLLRNGGFGLVAVGLLVFSFSVLIPLAKLTASLITLVRNRPPANVLHRFLVFQSSKWSMADVMVVAIFMSYIGFNGVINSQLTQLAAFSGTVELFTTNDSELQTGFYFFTAYCVVGLLLSAVIATRMHGLRPEIGQPVAQSTAE
ncbi:MAG: paraquat-inducible protein A [Bacteroidetes bacterium]|nr:paraquat-inducible protein A [Bacteroidota bacterium]